MRKNLLLVSAVLYILVILPGCGSGKQGVIEYLKPDRTARYEYAGEWGLEGFCRCEMLVLPIPIAVDPGGEVFVANPLTQQIRRYDPTGALLDEWYVVPPPPPGTFGLARYSLVPRAIAVAPDGNIYALCGDNVLYFSPNGDYLGDWGSRGTGDGEFVNPAGLAVAPDGRVYVADTFNERIQYFSSSGSFLGKWGSYGVGEGKFHYPEGIAVAPNGGVVYVTDTLNERVQYFSADGSFRGAWGEEGTGNGEFKYPNAVAVGPSGDVIVSDMSKDNVECFDRQGRFKGELEYAGATRRGDYFWGVAVAPSGDVYVSDGRDFEVRRFKRSASKRAYLWLSVVAILVVGLIGSLFVYRAIKRR